MAFLEVNKKKLAFLLADGAHEDELKRFFRDSRAQLILKGARMQNLPQGNSDRIKAICERLPRKTDEILRDWFQRNISLSDPMPEEDVYTYLELHFDQNEDIQAGDIKTITRSALIYLFEEKPNQELLSFLRREPGAPSSPAGIEDSEQECSDTASEENSAFLQGAVSDHTSTQPYSHQISELLSAVIANDERSIDNALTPFPSVIRTLVEGLLYIRAGDIGSASKHLEILEPNCPEAEYLKVAMGRARHQRGNSPHPTGVQLRTPQQLSVIPERESYEVIGTYTNESEAGAIFVRPIALKLDDDLYLLTRDDRTLLFPESGDVMTHRSEIRHQPKRRELLHWRVFENENSSGKTHFRLDLELEPIYEITPISVPSSDPDEIRERIKNLASSGQLSSSQQTVFILSDGIALLPPKSVDMTRYDAYEHTWQAWDSIETWLIEGRQYCLNLMSRPASNFDLSTPESYLKRTLKTLEAEQKATLSKVQRRELLELFRASQTSESRPRIERIASALEQVSLENEDLDTILNLLNAREEVRLRVQAMIDSDYATLKSEHSGLQAEIELLKHRRQQLKKEGKDIERSNKEAAEATASLVNEAFSKSINDGITTLANSEIFRMLGGTQRLGAPSPVSPSDTPLVETRTFEGSISLLDAKSRLVTLGLSRRQATILSELCSLVISSGIAFVMKGTRARQYAQVLLRIDCEVSGAVDVPMGLTSGAPLRSALNEISRAERIGILNADLSPFDVYGSRLLDNYYEAALEETVCSQQIILACLGGEMCLPLPHMMRHIAVVVDLDQPWDEGPQALAEVDIESIPLIESLRSRLLEKLTEVKVEYQNQVERALVQALVT
ncbi:hypothetical protein ACSC9U_26550 [Pseudomonas solani]|uniref:hypothetical protein n=1 Tax=Pseudomonas solani TaxID=2731552 RepID=UPI003F4AE88A